MESEKICELHGEELRSGLVGIRYGLPAVDYEWREAKKDLFPNSRSHVQGGCSLEDETEAEVLYCDSCRQAEKQWKDENRPGWDRPLLLF